MLGSIWMRRQRKPELPKKKIHKLVLLNQNLHNQEIHNNSIILIFNEYEFASDFFHYIRAYHLSRST